MRLATRRRIFDIQEKGTHIFPIPLRFIVPRREEHSLNVHPAAPLCAVKHLKLRVAAMIHHQRLAVLIDNF